MKICVLGARGMLGYELTRTLMIKAEDVSYTTRQESVFDNLPWVRFDPIHDDIKQLAKFDVIINCIGIVKSIADRDVQNTIRINSLFPLELADLCEERGMKLIHISTDCVYDGQRGLYTEIDPHNCHDIYGKSKSLGEAPNAMVLRTSIVGEEHYGSKGLLSWAKSQKSNEILGFINHKWNGMTVKQLSECIHQIIRNDLFCNGVHHVFSNDISKYELLKMFNTRFSLNLKIQQASTEFSVDRTLRTRCELLSKLNVPNIEQQIWSM